MIVARPERVKKLRAKLFEHLESAQVLADESGDVIVRYMIECALNQLRTTHWPIVNPNFDVAPGPEIKPKMNPRKSELSKEALF